ncbi:MAG TPA: LLM class flavin-dependent oxidoreductase [Nitrososphaeraceae archaeon]|nr:LLM class flavin-dependent oxidoreductase [Nitrososphaeraceae archaeon]
MKKIDKIGYNIGTLLSIDSILKFAKKIEEKENTDSLWVPESWGREAFVSLGALSQVTKRVRLGTAIINIYSRTPATVAMGVSTLDIISNQRTVLGLGVSTPALVENWHGIKFNNPIEKLSEYIQCIKLIMQGSKVNFKGKYYKINNFKILFKPPRENLPIYTAAINKKMIDLSCEFANGILLYLRPKHELPTIVEYIKNKLILKNSNNRNEEKRFEICCAFITAISDKNPEKARLRAAKTLAFYIAVGKYYNTFLRYNGFHTEVQNIAEEYQKNGISNIHTFVSDRMLNSLTISGSREDCMRSLSEFTESGISLPIIQINPVGSDPENSIMELISTF